MYCIVECFIRYKTRGAAECFEQLKIRLQKNTNQDEQLYNHTNQDEQFYSMYRKN